MKYILPAAIALAATLGACERPASTSSTTVVQPTKETIVQRDVPVTPPEPTSSTTIVNPPAPPTNVTIETSKPESVERSRSTTTERIDTPRGTVTRETTERSKTTR